MLYPEKFEQKIGFDKLKEIIRQNCLSSLGQFYADKIRFSSNYQHVKKLVDQTSEFRKILQLQEPFPQKNYYDVTEFIGKARMEGAYLEVEEIYWLRASLQTIEEIISYLRHRHEEYPQLFTLVSEVESQAQIIEAINRVMDEAGNIKDNASQELAQIRQRLHREQGRVRSVLDNIVQKAMDAGVIPDDISLTLRNGRMVIPVKAAYKRQIKGYIHDESASGQTVFLEPSEVFELNNEIRELELAEKKEIVKILQKLTSQVRPELDNLRKSYKLLGLIDFVRAKAKLAMRLDAQSPLSKPEAIADWYGARHPVLMLNFENQQKEVVPFHLQLNENQRIMIISGPNAGGKSVTLTSIGLLQYMYQCGLMVPIDAHSTMGIFRDIFIDIGDEQSIENDLSTYSSHLNNMRHFVKFSGKRSLFLIDEFGSGTDPQLGGAIAEAILERLNQKKSFGVITTHYNNLKKFADQNDGVVNASMRFDIDRLESLYQLETGKPGSSFALEIARKIGLDREILQRSQKKAGYEQVRFEKLLAQLEQEKQQLDQQLKEVQQKEQKLESTLAEYEKLKNHLDTEKKNLLLKARQEAAKLLEDANQKIENTIREIRQQSAEKESTKKMRADLEKYKEQVKPKEAYREEEPAKIEIEQGPVRQGDLARIKGQGTIGEVLTLRDNLAEIRIGSLKSKVKLNRLEKVSRKEARKVQPETSGTVKTRGINMNQKMADFSGSLDLRGKRGEEALSELEVFIDDALLLGSRELRIVHGKGDGILRQIVREHLRGYSQVKHMKDEHADRGGAGVTLVELG